MENLREAAVYISYALAAISGGLGAIVVTAHKFIVGEDQGRAEARLGLFLAYAIVGAVLGLLFAAYGLFLIDYRGPQDIIGPSLIAGFIGAASLGGVNTSARFILKHLGIEVVVTMRREKEERRNEDGDCDE